MQFVITILSDNPFDTISEIILSTAACGCRIADIKSSRFGDLNCAYLLVEGNWNELAKYESTLHAIEKKRELKNSMPYTVEIVGLENTDILHKVFSFLGERDVDIEEINGRHYSSPYLDTQLFSARLVISIPQSVSLFMLRDELMYTCDQINADIIFEPFRNQ